MTNDRMERSTNQPINHSIAVQIPVLHERPKQRHTRRRRHSTLSPSISEHLLEGESSSEADTPIHFPHLKSPSPHTNYQSPRHKFSASPRASGYRNRRHSILTTQPQSSPAHQPVHQSINEDSQADCASSSSFWPGTHELRRVFRSFDRDADGLISIGELRLGLAAMGFDVSHTANLTRLTAEMNADTNGQIKESSFVRVFRKLNREKIVEELKASAAEHEAQARLTQCVVVDIEQDTSSGQSPDQLPRLFMREEKVSPANLATYLLPTTPTMPRSTSSTRKVRWIDCIGVHAVTLSFLSNHFSLPPSCFDPALLSFDSTPHLAYSYEPMHGNGVLSVLMHAMALEQPKSQHHRSAYKFIRGRKQKSIQRTLTVLPCHVIVLGDHTVITIHPLTSSIDDNDIFEEFRSLLQASVAQDVPLASPFASTLHTSTAQSLAVELMDELTDWNWSMRDDLHQWKSDIESRLSERCKPSMLDEIHNIQAVSLQAQRGVSKMSAMLEIVVEDEDKYEMQNSHHIPTSDSTQPSTGTLDKNTHRMTHSQSMSNSFPVQQTQQFVDMTVRQSRHMFFSDIRRDFRALSANNSRMYADLKLTHELIIPLVGYYRQRRDEETNAILYLLTVLTALVTPLQLSSSIYGMNLQSMPEQSYPHSYLIFWIANLAIMLCIALLFKRKGWL